MGRISPASVPTVLIIDDLPLNVRLVSHVLESEGFRTLHAYTGADGIALCREHLPDILLLDVILPDRNGFDVCSTLKSDPRTADIPVVFLSALDDTNSKVRGLRTGGVDFISKPVHGDEVLARVRVHLQIAENNRAMVTQQQARIEALRGAQQAILVRPEDSPEACFDIFYQPLEETGGDFYDVVTIDSDVFGYFVADVSGHGPGAAFLTAAVKALLRQYSRPVYSPEDTLRGLDAVMRQILNGEQFVTACYVRLNRRTHTASVVSAGHPPVLLARAGGEVEVIEIESEAVGTFNSLSIQHRLIQVLPADRLFLYTDGLIECSRCGGRPQSIGRLADLCILHAREPLRGAVSAIAGDMIAYQPKVEDDLLLLGVEVAS